MAEDPRAKVLALIELALGKGTPPHEAAAAAMAACRRIREEGLLQGGKEEPRARRGWECPDDISGDDFVVLDVVFLVLTETSKAYRVARIQPPRKQSENVMLIPKEYVRAVVMMTQDETRAMGWKTSTIIKTITILRSYFETATSAGWSNYR